MSVEKVVATIDVPNSHQGIDRPDKKNSADVVEERLETHKLTPMATTNTTPTINQSKVDNLKVPPTSAVYPT